MKISVDLAARETAEFCEAVRNDDSHCDHLWDVELGLGNVPDPLRDDGARLTKIVKVRLCQPHADRVAELILIANLRAADDLLC